MNWSTVVGLIAPVFLTMSALGCDRPAMTMGRYIRSAAAIAIVDAEPNANRLTLTVHETLKGTGLPGSVSIRQSGCPYVPAGKGLAILLAPGWQTGDFPVVEVFTAVGDIGDLRDLIRIYQLPNERQRLDALRARLNDPRPCFREQLFDDLREIRERANFRMLAELYPLLDSAGRRKVIELIEYIGDERGVPVLVRALGEPDVADAARHTLSTYFRGGSGVREALRAHPAPPQLESEMQKAFRLFKEGRQAEARPLLQAVAVDPRESETIRLWAVLDLIGMADASGKRELLMAIQPLLEKIVREGDYLQIADAARILRGLRNPESIDLLVKVLARKEFVGQSTPYDATLAIEELGTGLRSDAIRRLKAIPGAAAMPYVQLSLAWLGGEIKSEGLRPLAGAANQTNQAAFLLRVLRTGNSLPPAGREWVVTRLGELKAGAAIPDLVKLLGTADYAVSESARHALVKIGWPEGAAEARRLLRSGAAPAARQGALNVLYELEGPRSLADLRGALGDHELRTTALTLLARVGTADDLKTLVPLSDFWTGDREFHYWIMLAVAEIRGRGAG